MAFDIFFAPVPGLPFDGDAVQRLLDADAARSHLGATVVTTRDGGADIYGPPDPDSWLMVNHAEGSDVWELMYQMAAAGPYQVMPIGCETFVTAADHLGLVPDEAQRPIVLVACGAEMQALVGGLLPQPAIVLADARSAFERFAVATGEQLDIIGPVAVCSLMTS